MADVLAITGIVAVGVGIYLAIIAWRILTGNSQDYERNRILSGDRMRVATGQLSSVYSGTTSDRTASGLALKKTADGQMRWVANGRLTDEALISALHK